MLYDIGDTAEVLRWYRELLPSLPEELSGWFGVMTIPPAAPVPRGAVGTQGLRHRLVLHGPPRPRRRGARPGAHLRSPLVVGMHEMPFNVLQSAFNALYPAGLQWYWRADMYETISDEAIDVHSRFGESLPTGHSTMHLYPIDGAAARVAQDATAFAYRAGGWAGVMVGVSPDPADNPAMTEWAKSYWSELHPTSAGGAYVNFMMDEGEDRVRAAYRGNYARLTQVKTAYDPTNFFHVNQNIRPA